MSLHSAWQARSGDASRIELEACGVRAAFAVIVLAYVAWFYSRRAASWTESDKLVMSVLVAWLLIAVGFFVVTWMWPGPNVLRRVLGIILDVGAVTWALYVLDPRGFTVAPLYLLIIFSNGFRFGRRYLFLAQCLSVVGWVLFTTYASWWNYRPDVAAGWLMALLVIPPYVGELSRRLDVARAKAEQALKECMERQPRLS